MKELDVLIEMLAEIKHQNSGGSRAQDGVGHQWGHKVAPNPSDQNQYKEYSQDKGQRIILGIRIQTLLYKPHSPTIPMHVF